MMTLSRSERSSSYAVDSRPRWSLSQLTQLEMTDPRCPKFQTAEGLMVLKVIARPPAPTAGGDSSCCAQRDQSHRVENLAARVDGLKALGRKLGQLSSGVPV